MNFYDKIVRFSNRIKANFSVPGHKGGTGIFYALKQNPFALDVTESRETDDLSAPNGIIKDTQSDIAEIFGAHSAHILVNGSTIGIQAMIMSVCRNGDKLIVDRCCHRSVIGALILCGVEPIFIERGIIKGFLIRDGISVESIQEALRKNPEAKGVIITSPSYYGICSDVRGIASLMHQHDKFLLVDEAHGAHFAFSENMPPSAIAQGADMAVVSVHKTLPCPTQTALLLVSERCADKNVKDCINLLQTTSPSYMLMTAMTEGIYATRNNCSKLDEIIEYCKNFTDEINKTGMVKVLTLNDIKHSAATHYDPTRLVINFTRAGVDAYSMASMLWEKHGILCEMSDDFNIVCIVTAYNAKSELDMLKNSILDLLKNANKEKDMKITATDIPCIQMAMPPREAFYAESKTICIQEACGCICAEIVSACPPGIAVAVPGQVIDESLIEYISKMNRSDYIRVVHNS